MRLTLLSSLGLLTIVLFGCSTPSASSSASSPPSSNSTLVGAIRVDGDVPATRFTAADLEALTPVEVEWSHKGESQTYRAVPLEAELRRAGVEPGSMNPGVTSGEMRAGWKFAVVATANDGYQAAFSVPEVFHDMGRTEAYVAFGENCGPIPAVVGPFRLIVKNDGEAARSLRNLERLTVEDLRRVAPTRPELR